MSLLARVPTAGAGEVFVTVLSTPVYAAIWLPELSCASIWLKTEEGFVLGAFLTLATLKLNLVPDEGVPENVNLTRSLLEEGEVQVTDDIAVTTVHTGVDGRVISDGN